MILLSYLHDFFLLILVHAPTTTYCLISPLFHVYCLQKGTKAPQAAGRIHSDMEKGFIMAEVMKFEDFKEEGSETAVKVSSCA